MLLAPTVRPEQRHRIPGVVHADGTARVQTVAHHDNRLPVPGAFGQVQVAASR